MIYCTIISIPDLLVGQESGTRKWGNETTEGFIL